MKAVTMRMTCGRAVLCSVAVLAVASLLGCGSLPPLTTERRVEYSEQVANVFVAAYPAVPWSAISEKLQPQHNLSTAAARDMAAVTTQAQVGQMVSMMSAGLGIGLPSRTAASTTNISADGTAVTTGTRSTASGTVPTSSGAAALADGALAPDLSKAPAAMGLDAATQLMVGTGVYQLAKILDNQITGSITPKGYEAHLLTLQVNLQPLGRNLPYDAYVNVTMLPATWTKAVTASADVAKVADGLPPVIVYPLVVTDAMETASVGRSLEVVRQAALQLSGIVANAGLNLGFNSGTDRLDSILGSDRNSLVTLGRVSDHTIRIRLGAQAQGSRQLALVPRTHNVSVVVFTRAGDTAATHVDRLAVITETSFVDVETGISRDSIRRDRAALKDEVERALDGYHYAINPACKSARDPNDSALDLLRAVDRSDYGYISRCLSHPQGASAPLKAAIDTNTITSLLQRTLSNTDLSTFRLNTQSNDGLLEPAEEATLRRLLASLMTIQVSSRYSKLLVQLTPFPEPVAPVQEQLAFMVDDTKSSAVVVLREGKQLKPEKLRARLKFAQGQNQITLVPTQVTVEADNSVRFVFPSIVANKLQTEVPDKDTTKPAQLRDPASIQLQLTHEPAISSFRASTYTVKYLKAEDDPPVSPVSTSTSVLVPDSSGIAKLTLLVGAWTGKGELGVRISGADVRAIEPAAAFDTTRKAVPLAQKSSVVLTLGNLSPAQPVQVRTIAGKESVGSAILLAVQPATAQK